METQATTTIHHAMIGTPSVPSPTTLQAPDQSLTKQQAMELIASVLAAQNTTTNNKNNSTTPQQPQRITSCPYCDAIEHNTTWTSQTSAAKLKALSKQNFDNIHEQFTNRSFKQILPPAGCLLFLLAPFKQRVVAVSKSTNLCPICLAIPNTKMTNGQCQGEHAIRRRPDNRQNVLCMQPGCKYNHLICQKHRDLNKGHPLRTKIN